MTRYNFVRIHQILRCTPAMAADVSTTLWELTDMLKVLEDGRQVKHKGAGLPHEGS